jgi:hypothetical protein
LSCAAFQATDTLVWVVPVTCRLRGGCGALLSFAVVTWRRARGPRSRLLNAKPFASRVVSTNVKTPSRSTSDVTSTDVQARPLTPPDDAIAGPNDGAFAYVILRSRQRLLVAA